MTNKYSCCFYIIKIIIGGRVRWCDGVLFVLYWSLFVVAPNEIISITCATNSNINKDIVDFYEKREKIEKFINKNIFFVEILLRKNVL